MIVAQAEVPCQTSALLSVSMSENDVLTPESIVNLPILVSFRLNILYSAVRVVTIELVTLLAYYYRFISDLVMLLLFFSP